MNPYLDDEVAVTVRDLLAALSDLNVTAVIIGGVAASLLATPRFTHDVDALILFDTADAEVVLQALERHGFRAAFSGMIEFAQQARLVTVRHTGTGVVADVALGCMPFEEETIQRSQLFHADDLEVRLPTPEDLVIFKAIANRPKDQEDIRSLSAAYPSLDRARIRHWVEQYAELLETPGLWQEIASLLDDPQDG